jgi:uncharacterized OsmC-like protein
MVEAMFCPSNLYQALESALRFATWHHEEHRTSRLRKARRRGSSDIMDLRSIQGPLKEGYRSEPSSARITLKAQGSQTDTPMACSIDTGRAIYQAQAHAGVGGVGTAACSGDLLLGALAACAQITCQMVAEAMGIQAERVEVEVEGDLDLRGTLGVSKEVPVGFEDIRLRFDIEAPEATEEQLKTLRERTERYCVVLQTLTNPPTIRAQ